MEPVTFRGPSGDYTLRFVAAEDSKIEVAIGGLELSWYVYVLDSDGTLQGLTSGLQELWGDEYWFVLTPVSPMQISFYGTGVLVRTDHERLN